MEKKILLVACALGFLAIIFGAFGAHTLKKTLTIEQLNSFETGVKYQMYHALFLLFIGVTQIISLKEKTIVFYLTLTGVLFFSGSIYVLTTACQFILIILFEALIFIIFLMMKQYYRFYLNKIKNYIRNKRNIHR